MTNEIGITISGGSISISGTVNLTQSTPSIGDPFVVALLTIRPY